MALKLQHIWQEKRYGEKNTRCFVTAPAQQTCSVWSTQLSYVHNDELSASNWPNDWVPVIGHLNWVA